MSTLPDFWRSGLSRPLDRFFEDYGFLPTKRAESELAKYGFSPQCEVSEDEGNYLMKVDLPGIQKDQIKIELHENRLTISGERKEEVKNDSKKKHFSEVTYGAFTRSFTFPTSVNSEKVLAQYADGILNLTIPKSESNRARQIFIK